MTVGQLFLTNRESIKKQIEIMSLEIPIDNVTGISLSAYLLYI